MQKAILFCSIKQLPVFISLLFIFINMCQVFRCFPVIFFLMCRARVQCGAIPVRALNIITLLGEQKVSLVKLPCLRAVKMK